MFLKSNGEDLTLQLLIVGGKVYLGGSTVLAALNAGSKKWALASKNSGNPALRTLAGQLDSYLGTASAGQYELYARAARSIVDDGAQQLGGVSTHKYTVTVDVATLAKLMTGTSAASVQALLASGVTALPTTIWFDPTDRVVQSTSTVKTGGVTTTSQFKVTAYNVAVAIKAPNPADVYTG